MYTKFKIKSIVPKLMMAAFAVLFMGSCTVYKYPDRTSEDGIYSPSRTYRGQADGYAETNNYYKQYFQSKQGSYSEILVNDNESTIFTDVDAYNTKEYVGEDGFVYSENIANQEESYGGWGNNSTAVNINFYSYGGHYNPYFNSFYGHWGNPYYGYRPYNPRWYGGFNWWYGWNGFYSPFYYPSYNHGYGHSNYYRPYYNNVSYNRGRRNSDYRGRSVSTSGRSTTNNSGLTTRGRSTMDYDGRRGNSTNSTLRRENSATNQNSRRNSSVNRRNSNQVNQSGSKNPRRVTFPEQTRRNNTSTPNRTQQTRRNNTTVPNRSNQVRRESSINRTQRTNRPATMNRSSAPTRNSTPSARPSTPTRSSAPASRGRSGGRR